LLLRANDLRFGTKGSASILDFSTIAVLVEGFKTLLFIGKSGSHSPACTRQTVTRLERVQTANKMRRPLVWRCRGPDDGAVLGDSFCGHQERTAEPVGEQDQGRRRNVRHIVNQPNGSAGVVEGFDDNVEEGVCGLEQFDPGKF
jgi:hypothetical protein